MTWVAHTFHLLHKALMNDSDEKCVKNLAVTNQYKITKQIKEAQKNEG